MEDYQTWLGRIPAGTHGEPLGTDLASVIVKAIPSSPLSELLDEPGQVRRLFISAWLDEIFAIPIRDRREARLPDEMTDWDSIGAVGAADDATRFRIDFETLDHAGSPT